VVRKVARVAKKFAPLAMKAGCKKCAVLKKGMKAKKMASKI
jgi:hypothetical protein